MIVLDASALIDVLIDQPDKAWVLQHLAGEQVMAPAHQQAEVLSGIARLVRAGTLTPEAAREALGEAASLPQELVPPTAGHLLRALDMQDQVRVLDALYIVVAQDHDATLITTDRRLARADVPVPIAAPPAG